MGWEMKKLDAVCDIIAGQSPESTYYNKEGNGKPFFQGKADFNEDYPTVRYYTTKTTKTAKVNDILLSVRAPVGPTNICDIEACIGRGLAAIRPKDNVYYKYIYFYFKFIEKKLSLTGNGSTFSAITTADVKNIDIPVPSFKLQRQFAEILDKADALRKKDGLLFQYYDDLAQSLFIDMFGDPVKNEKKWDKKPLGEIFQSFKYGTNEKSYEEKLGDALPVLRIPNIIGDKISLQGLKYSILSQKEAVNTELKSGDLLFVRTNGNPNFIGRSAVFNLSEKFSYASYLIRARMAVENYPLSIYLQFALSHNSYRPLILKKATTTAGNYNINTESLKSLIVQTPAKNILKLFSEIIENINQQKAILKIQIDESENLFQGLLQQAFNGSLN